MIRRRGSLSRRGSAWLAVALLASGCASAASPLPSPAPVATTASLVPAAPQADGAVVFSPSVQAMVDGVSRAELEPAVAQLSGAAPATVGGQPFTFRTRSAFSGEQIDKVEQYLFEQLQSYGLDSVEYQEFPGSDDEPPGRNVIGEITGTTEPDEIVVIGAHMDDRPWSGRAPGADDDASGVSAVLYLARAFAGHDFGRTIRFALFGDEENAPFDSRDGKRYGSGYYAYHARQAGEDIVAMVEADMLAYDPRESSDQIVELHIRKRADDPDGGDLEIYRTWRQGIELYGIDGITPVKMARSMGWSDHASFWKQDYDAALLIEEEWDNFSPYYHSKRDTIATLDWPYYVQVVRTLVALAAHEARIAA